MFIRRIFKLAFMAMMLASLSSCDTGDSGRGDAQPGDPCGGTIDCTPGSICWNSICIQDGALRFSLSWTVDTDLDLHVLTPSGTEIYYSNPVAEGGTLDVDDCVGGSCTTAGGTHVENIFFAEAPASGTYLFWVDNYDCSQAADFHIEAAEGTDVLASFDGSLPAACGTSEQYTVVY
jgi:hypothetical protein